jgi:type V secretory pathway adhesin AidA
MDRRIAQDKIIGFALGLGKQDRTSTGSDFSGDIDTTQYSLSSYGALELSNKGSIEALPRRW